MADVARSPALSSKLILAAKRGDPALVSDLLKQGCSPDERDKNGSTALMHAIWHAAPGTGYFDVVELLVEAGADVNLQNVRMNTALHFAFERNNSALVDYLLDHGAVASESKKNSLGLLPRQLQPHHHPIKQYIRNTLPRTDLPDTMPVPQPITAPSRRYLNRTFTSSSDGFSLADVFNAADTDGDGLISTSEEVKVALHAIGLPWTHGMQSKFQSGGLKTLRASLSRRASIGEMSLFHVTPLHHHHNGSHQQQHHRGGVTGGTGCTVPANGGTGACTTGDCDKDSPTDAVTAPTAAGTAGAPAVVPAVPSPAQKPALHPGSPSVRRSAVDDSFSASGTARPRLVPALSSPTIRSPMSRDSAFVDLNMFCRIVTLLQQFKRQSIDGRPTSWSSGISPPFLHTRQSSAAGEDAATFMRARRSTAFNPRHAARALFAAGNSNSLRGTLGAGLGVVPVTRHVDGVYESSAGGVDGHLGVRPLGLPRSHSYSGRTMPTVFASDDSTRNGIASSRLGGAPVLEARHVRAASGTAAHVPPGVVLLDPAPAAASGHSRKSSVGVLPRAGDSVGLGLGLGASSSSSSGQEPLFGPRASVLVRSRRDSDSDAAGKSDDDDAHAYRVDEDDVDDVFVRYPVKASDCSSGVEEAAQQRRKSSARAAVPSDKGTGYVSVSPGGLSSDGEHGSAGSGSGSSCGDVGQSLFSMHPSVSTGLSGGASKDDVSPQVFLGGACNPTTWRVDTAIPALEAAGVSYYNPQVDAWTPDLVDTEAEAKARAEVVLFVVCEKTRGVASMVEASELVACQQNIVLVLRDIPVGGRVNGEVVPLDELRDLNRGRAYLADVASRHGCPVFQTVEAGVEEVLRRLGIGCSSGNNSSGESSP